MFTNIMKLEGRIRNTIKTLSLALLISYSSSNITYSNLNFLGDDEKKIATIKGFLNGLRTRNTEKMREYSTGDLIEVLKKFRMDDPPYEDRMFYEEGEKVVNDIPFELFPDGYYKDNKLWVFYRDFCQPFLVKKIDGKWKVSDTGMYFRRFDVERYK